MSILSSIIVTKFVDKTPDIRPTIFNEMSTIVPYFSQVASFNMELLQDADNTP